MRQGQAPDAGQSLQAAHRGRGRRPRRPPRRAGGPLAESFQILRALPHGALLAVLGELHQLGLDNLIAARPRRERELSVAMIASRILAPASKLATVRSWQNSTLASDLGVEDADEDEL